MFWGDRPSSRVRRTCLILYWIFIYILTHWPDIDRFMPHEDWPFHEFDKVVHALMYAGWAIVWGWMLVAYHRQITRTMIGWLIVGGAVYGAFDEITQALVDRQPDILDWSCDMAGLVAALVALHFLQRRQMVIRARVVV